jgi:hypothetical protein
VCLQTSNPDRRAVCHSTLIVGLVLHLTAMVGGAAPVASVSLRTFVTDLDRLARHVRASDSAGAAAIRDSLPDRWIVLDGAERFEVPSGAVAAALQSATRDPVGWTSRRTVVAAEIDTMRAEAATLLEGQELPSLGTARGALNDVLSAPEFRQRSHWFSRWQKRFERWLEALAGRLGLGRIPSSRVARGLVWMVALCAVGVLVFWLIRTFRRTVATGVGLHFGESIGGRRASADWIARALQSARAGDLREAMRCAYQALVFRLEEEGVWRVDEARTPREYLRLLRPSDRRHTAVADVIHRFERVWYGGVVADPGEAGEIMRRLRELGCDLPAEIAN